MSEISKPSASLPKLDDLGRAVEAGQVSTRDASLWAGSMGLKVLPERPIDAPFQYGVGDRRARQVIRSVDAVVSEDDHDGVGPKLATAGAATLQRTEIDFSVALVGAELDVTDHPWKEDALHSWRTLGAQVQGEPIRRQRPAMSGRRRTRSSRIRPVLAERVRLLSAWPRASLEFPYLVIPQVLPPRLYALVPSTQLRRSRPPDEAWLAELTRSAGEAYGARRLDARDLITMAIWGFARLPGAVPELEAQAMRVAATMAREQGRLSALWFAERVRVLLGDDHPDSLFAAHDAAIALRNHGFATAANQLLDRTLTRAARADIPVKKRLLAQSVLLGQVRYNRTHTPLPVTDDRRWDPAREAVERGEIVAEELGMSAWLASAARSRFDLELNRAIHRGKLNRERVWLHSAALVAYDQAEVEIDRSDKAIWHAQWQVLRMEVALECRWADMLVDGAHRFVELCRRHPWIPRDHLSERRQYEKARHGALRARLPGAESLEPMSVRRQLTDCADRLGGVAT